MIIEVHGKAKQKEILASMNVRFQHDTEPDSEPEFGGNGGDDGGGVAPGMTGAVR